MSEDNEQNSGVDQQKRVRPMPPNVKIPITPLGNSSVVPTSPTSPPALRKRPLPPNGPPPSHVDHSASIMGQETRPLSPRGTENAVAHELRQRPLPPPQRALSPTPTRPLPPHPPVQVTSRPLSPPPKREELVEQGFVPPIAESSSSTSHSLNWTHRPRAETDLAVIRRLGPIPSREAPAPPTESEQTSATPPLAESPLAKRSASASAPRTLDMSNSDLSKAKQGSSGLFGLLGRSPSRAMSPSLSNGSDSASPATGDQDRMRVHYKSLSELPESYFSRVPPAFSPASHRDRVGFEFYTSELSYNTFMRILIEVYKVPMLSAQKAGHVNIKEDDVQKIFGPIESVLRVSDIILSALEERISAWNPDTQIIGDIFVKYGDVLKVYATFAADQRNSKIAQSHCHNSKSYQQLLKMSQQNPVCQSRDLSSLLIMPIQRIPRYELLLRDFIKATTPSHPDLTFLNQALAKIKSVAEQVDRSVEEYKHLEKLLAIQDSFSGSSVNLVTPGRKFIKEGSLVKVCRRANKTRKFWLFNDILLYGIPLLTGTNVASGEFPLKYVQLQDLPDAQEDDAATGSSIPTHQAHRLSVMPSQQQQQQIASGTAFSGSDASMTGKKPIFQFMIQSRTKSFVVIANSLQEKADWMVAIMTAATESQEAARSLQSGGSKTLSPTVDVAPAWVPDALAKNCRLCNAEFGLVTRRHHCRHCGSVVCAECSKNRIVLTGLDKSPVRVCDTCNSKLGYGSFEANKSAPAAPKPQENPTYTSSPINLLSGLTPPPNMSPNSPHASTHTAPKPHENHASPSINLLSGLTPPPNMSPPSHHASAPTMPTPSGVSEQNES